MGVENFRKTYLDVNLFSLAKNYAELKNEVGANAFFCPMVKANAYGHGDVQVARTLNQLGCETLGVAFIEEGIHLRQHQIGCDVFVFCPFDLDGAKAIVEYDLTPIISSFESLELLCKALIQMREEHFPIHVEINTGMNRLGFAPTEGLQLLEFLRSHSEVRLTGLCTHLAFGDDAGEPAGRTTEALEQFYAVEKIFTEMRPVTHIYNSAGLINVINMRKRNLELPTAYRWPEGARPGLALYGYALGVREPTTVKLLPLTRLRSQLVKLHELRAGETVSYGGIWTAPKKCTIGVVPVGYADGYPRQLSNKSFVLFRGQRLPVIGHICMDYLMIDITPLTRDNLQLGEEVVLWGEQNGQRLTLEELCEPLETIPYALLTGVGGRVFRKYIQE